MPAPITLSHEAVAAKRRVRDDTMKLRTRAITCASGNNNNSNHLSVSAMHSCHRLSVAVAVDADNSSHSLENHDEDVNMKDVSSSTSVGTCSGAADAVSTCTNHSSTYKYDVPPSPCGTSTTSSPATPRSCDEADAGSNISFNSYGISSTSGHGSKYTIRYSGDASMNGNANKNANSNSNMNTNMNTPGKVLPPPQSVNVNLKLLSSPRRSPSAPLDPQYASRMHRTKEEAEKDKHDALLMPPPTLWRNTSGSKGHGYVQSTRISTARTDSSTVFHSPVNSQEEREKESVNTHMNDGITSANDGSTCTVGPTTSSMEIDTTSPQREKQLHTPLCTPEGRRPGSIHRNNSSNNSKKSTFDFYTPRRSPRSLIGHKISFSTPARSIKSLSDGISSSGRKNSDSSPRYSDRFIPSRSSSNLSFSVWDNDDHRRKSDSSDGGGQGHNAHQSSEDDTPRQDLSAHYNSTHGQQQPPLLNMLLRSELLGENIDPTSQNSQFGSYGQSPSNNRNPLREGGNYLQYNQSQVYRNGVFSQYAPDPTTVVDSFSLSPVRMSSNHHLMSMPQKRKRKISKVPFKVLDAPALADDFYLNLVDWSSLNVLAVGLGSCVYLWSACTSKVTKLCDLSNSSNQDNDRAGTNDNAVTSVSWTQRGTHLAVGVNNGEVQLWDTVKCKMIRTMGGHSARIGALSWSGPTLASGSRDRLIYLRDMRVQQPFTARLASHKQEVCGLKWSFDEPAHLASGGNDNKLLVWDIKKHRQPTHRFEEHTAAVKAIAWSPHQHGLLASGGGTADRCIRFWNALSGSPLNSIDTGSQVCNLAWSQNCNEIVSTHGYSLNQIALWKYPTMQKVATLTGHTYRVLYLAMSPDGSTIVTGAGDETLRFWQVFPGPRCNDKNGKNGLLFPSSPFSVLR